MLGEWERGNRHVATDADITGDRPLSQELQIYIEELDSANQQQVKGPMSARAESALKSKGLEMILAKTRGLREGKETLTEYYTTTLRLEPNYKDSNCKTIHSEDRLLSAGDLATTGKYCDEIEVLEKSISVFIVLYRHADILLYNSNIEILEQQKDVSKAQLTISNKASDRLETNTPGIDRILSIVKKRAGIIEREARNVYNLQTELEAARKTTAAQRQHLEALDEELKEAWSKATTLQEEYQTAISSFEEVQKVAQDENEAVQKEVEGASNLRAELSTAKAENKVLQNRKAELGKQIKELDRQIKGSTETWRTEEACIHDLEQNLTEARSLLQATSNIQRELDKAQSDLNKLRQQSSLYIHDIKTARDMYRNNWRPPKVE